MSSGAGGNIEDTQEGMKYVCYFFQIQLYCRSAMLAQHTYMYVHMNEHIWKSGSGAEYDMVEIYFIANYGKRFGMENVVMYSHIQYRYAYRIDMLWKIILINKIEEKKIIHHSFIHSFIQINMNIKLLDEKFYFMIWRVVLPFQRLLRGPSLPSFMVLFFRSTVQSFTIRLLKFYFGNCWRIKAAQTIPYHPIPGPRLRISNTAPEITNWGNLLYFNISEAIEILILIYCLSVAKHFRSGFGVAFLFYAPAIVRLGILFLRSFVSVFLLFPFQNIVHTRFIVRTTMEIGYSWCCSCCWY